jgi:urate oxidase
MPHILLLRPMTRRKPICQPKGLGIVFKIEKSWHYYVQRELEAAGEKAAAVLAVRRIAEMTFMVDRCETRAKLMYHVQDALLRHIKDVEAKGSTT